MPKFCRIAHALAVSLWFGSVAFFTVAGLLIFQAMDEAAEKNAPWLSKEFGKDAEGLPPWIKERGSRAAGAVVSRIFPFYFALQAGCAAVALATAFLVGGRVRIVVCLLGVLVVGGGWYLNEKVSGLRKERNELADRVYLSESQFRGGIPSAAATRMPLGEAKAAAQEHDATVMEAQAARQAFGMWHGVSLLVNFAALGLAFWLACLLGWWTTSPRPASGAA